MRFVVAKGTLVPASEMCGPSGKHISLAGTSEMCLPDGLHNRFQPAPILSFKALHSDRHVTALNLTVNDGSRPG